MAKKKKIRIKYNNIVAVLILFACLIGVIYSSIKILSWKKAVDENDNIKDEIDGLISVDEEKNTYDVDFDEIRKQNSDAIAYLKVFGTNIDYIVVQGKDNEYYLDHNFNKKYNIAGWVFADYHNRFDGTDKNIIIYGHNMQNGSMFGSLHNVLNKTWYEDENNHKIILVTELGQYEYEVFSTYSIVSEDYYIMTNFSDGIDFGAFVKKLESRSVYNYNVSVSADDSILTLSSCIGDGTKRVVLHAKLLKDSD